MYSNNWDSASSPFIFSDSIPKASPPPSPILYDTNSTTDIQPDYFYEGNFKDGEYADGEYIPPEEEEEELLQEEEIFQEDEQLQQEEEEQEDIFSDLTPLIKFFLDELNKEIQSNHEPATLNQPGHALSLLQSKVMINLFLPGDIRSVCSCSRKQMDVSPFCLDLIYPQTQNEPTDFLTLLKMSYKSSIEDICTQCVRPVPPQNQPLLNIPNLFCVSTSKSQHFNQFSEFWRNNNQSIKTNTFFPILFSVSKNTSDFEYQKIGIENLPQKFPQNTNYYQLTAIIYQIHNSKSKQKHKQNHYVAFINVHQNYEATQGKIPANQLRNNWYFFNDFRLSKVDNLKSFSSKESQNASNKNILNEVLSFDIRWKIPCLLVYSRLDLDKAVPITNIVNPITEQAFFVERNHRLKKEDLPRKGDLLAIDAEFVSLFGDSPTNKGSFSLARVSVIKAPFPSTSSFHSSLERLGKLNDNSDVLLDDYIATPEPIADYLTRFSGIVAGDLDPLQSPHKITSLKAAYLKLRFLVDQGCIFVGHGLKKDFRIINVFVPPEQVIDTVELFNLKGQRMISLRYLAAKLLNISIQAETHCSIEDARTALSLFEMYKKLQKEHNFEEELAKIYHVGRLNNWQITSNDST